MSINDKTDPMDIVNELNKYFSTIGPELDSAIGPSNLILNYNNRPNIPLLKLQDTTEEEVKKLLMAISDSKATGDDGIPIRFLKMIPDIISTILTHIINTSIRTNVVLKDSKTATITPIFKEGERNLPSNYRPISILPALKKILERVIHN